MNMSKEVKKEKLPKVTICKSLEFVINEILLFDEKLIV